MDYLGRDLHNGQPATERPVGCVGKVAMQRKRKRESGSGRKEGLNCAAGSSLPTNRVPPYGLCHAYCTQTQPTNTNNNSSTYWHILTNSK